MSLHIKTVQITTSDSTIYAMLHMGRGSQGLGIYARITRAERGTKEKLLGIAGINREGELVQYPQDKISFAERDQLEVAIKETVGE